MRLFVSDTDSFIEEVSEEVRRDRLYKVLRKYAWVGILAVVTIVGGTAYLEFQKAQARTEAEAVGTAIINALDISNLEERAEELKLLSMESEKKILKDVIKTINQIIDQNKLKGIFDERRADQLEYWIEEEVKNMITSDITKRLTSKGNIPKYSEKVMKNEMSMYEAVETITKDTLKQ